MKADWTKIIIAGLSVISALSMAFGTYMKYQTVQIEDSLAKYSQEGLLDGVADHIAEMKGVTRSEADLWIINIVLDNVK